MFRYMLKIALLSLRRNPVLSVLLVIAIALGVALSTASLTVYTLFAGNPIPHKSEQLFYVEIDSWEKDKDPRPYAPGLPPEQITFRDSLGLMKSDIPTYQSAMVASYPTVFPAGEGQKPHREIVRMCYAGFFPMFDVPFAYGSGWDKQAEKNGEAVIVLDEKTNLELFGGENSVGKTLRIENQHFTIVGVLKHWRPMPRFYDVLAGNKSDEPEGIFMPFGFFEKLELDNYGNTHCHGPVGPNFQDFLKAECHWIQMWVQLDTQKQKSAYLAFLDAYAMEQKKLGRFPRPLNNRVLSVMEWMHDQRVVPDEAKGVLLISLLFLVVCAVNLIGILLGKFLARAPEVGVRRALGATKKSVFIQHLLECELVGILGGLSGLGLSVLVLKFIGRSLGKQELFLLDLRMVFAGLVLSVFAGLLAGLYPAWRICKTAPATHLKLQ